MITTTSEWFKPDEKLPDEDCNCLAIRRDRPHFTDCLSFATDLHHHCAEDFPDETYSHPGFFTLNLDSYKFEEVPISNIVYWTKTPFIEKEEK